MACWLYQLDFGVEGPLILAEFCKPLLTLTLTVKSILWSKVVFFLNEVHILIRRLFADSLLETCDEIIVQIFVTNASYILLQLCGNVNFTNRLCQTLQHSLSDFDVAGPFDSLRVLETFVLPLVNVITMF